MEGFDLITGLVTKVISSEFKAGWIIFGIFALLLIIFTIRRFLDVAIDLWKMPFAIVLDALRLIFLGSTVTIILLGIANIIVFWMLAKKRMFLGKVLGILAAALSLGGTLYFQEYASAFSIIPVSSVLMFIMIWAD